MNEPMFYVASTYDMPGYYAMCVDDPRYTKEAAEFIAEVLAEGGHITRVNGEEMRRGADEYLKARKARQEWDAA